VVESGAAHIPYLQGDGVRHFTVEHQKDGKLGIAGPGFAQEVDGLLNKRGGMSEGWKS